MIRRPLPLAIAILFLGAPFVHAQEARVVAPGGVATVSADIPIESKYDRTSQIRFAFTAEPSVRAFPPIAGSLELPASGPLRVPLAIWIDAGRPAGRLSVGTLEVSWPDGRRTRHPLTVRVAPRRIPEVDLVTETVQGGSGEFVEIPVRIANRGNLADTVGVRAEPPTEWEPTTAEDRRVVHPDETVIVPVRLLIPSRARPGEVRRVRIAATGRDSVSSAVARVLVVRPGAVGGFESVPTAVFLGSSGGGNRSLGENFVAAIDARGRIGQETEIWLSARDANVVGTAAAFRRLAGGPELRLGLRRARWEAFFGEVDTRHEPLVGDRLWGRGGRVRWKGSRASVEGILARPTLSSGPDRGHLALGSLFLDLGGVDVGLVLSDLSRPIGGTAGRSSSRGAALKLELEAPSGHRLRAEAGALAIRDAHGRERFGPAGELDWSWRGEETTVHVQARGVPATAAATGTRGDALSIGVHRRIAGPLSMSGNGFWTSYPALDPKGRSSHRGGSAALRFSPVGLQFQVGTSLRASDFDARGLGSSEARSAWATAHLPLGLARLDIRAEATVERSGDLESATRAYRAMIPWTGRQGWLSIGAVAWTGGFDGERIQAQAAGEVDLASVTLGGAVYLRRAGDVVRSEGYGSVAVDVAPDLATVVGVERNDGEGAAWSFSIGLRKRFGMPLPFPRAAAVSGVVFDDLNGDGRRNEGEPGLPGVRVRVGPLEALTDGTGRFRLEEAPMGGGRVRLDLTSLDAGAIAPFELDIDHRGRVEIPVVHPASIEIEAFFDHDADGLRDRDEPPTAGALVQAIDANSKIWTAVTDASGSARFRALAPGIYRIHVRVEPSLDTRAVDRLSRVELESGKTTSVRIPLETATKEIRF